MHFRNLTTIKFSTRVLCVLAALTLAGCGGGGGTMPRPTVLPLALPAGHGLPSGEITVPPGESEEHGNVVLSCPAGGQACVLNVAADGSASYARRGGMPSIMAALATQTLPPGHGLGAGGITVAPGQSMEHGNVVVSCPAGGNACVLNVAADGSASYERTGGMPSVMPALAAQTLPPGHGLGAGGITVAPGESMEHGNVVVSCPAGGNACVLDVAADGSASYERTGGMPSIMPALAAQTLPPGHGLGAGEITVDPGQSMEHGNVVVSCPAGGETCVLKVAADGTASYQRTGGMPAVMPAFAAQTLPTGHGLSAGDISVDPGQSMEHGNVVISCPAGGSACALNVAADGSASYDRTGGMPSVAYPLPTQMAAFFNGLSEEERDRAYGGFNAGAFRDAVSSTATDTDPNSILNVGVTMSRYNREPNIAVNWVLHARYNGDDLDFELRELVEDERYPLSVLAGAGFITTRLITPIAGSTRFKGIAFADPEGSPLHGVLWSDIEDNNDTDYLAMGFRTADDDESGQFDVLAVASGNDLFQVENIGPLTGGATYRGNAAGLYASRVKDPAFRYFNADVSLTADFEENQIWGLVTNFVDPATDEQIVSGVLTLENSGIRTDETGFFRSRSVGVVNGKYFRGEWGGHFFGNGESPTNPPGSVAGTFDAALRFDRSEYLIGAFGAYYDGEPTAGPVEIPTPSDPSDGFSSRVVADLNDLPETVSSQFADRARSAAGGIPVSTTEVDVESVSQLTGVTWNTGVTQGSRNSWTSNTPTVIRESVAINARYAGQELVFDRKNLARTTSGYVSTEEEPAEPGYRMAIPATLDAPWKGVEHFFISGTNGRQRQVLYSDIQDNGDSDYLALGYWAWLPEYDNPEDTRSPFVGAVASGNDPFEVGNIEPLEGQAKYAGDAFGLYTAKGATVASRAFSARVNLTADFDQSDGIGQIGGTVTAGRDMATNAPIFDGLALENADIQTANAAFFRASVRGVVNGRYAQGRWGGQFYGNGPVTESPGSVAGTFGARTEDNSESLIGAFGAHREP